VLIGPCSRCSHCLRFLLTKLHEPPRKGRCLGPCLWWFHDGRRPRPSMYDPYKPHFDGHMNLTLDQREECRSWWVLVLVLVLSRVCSTTSVADTTPLERRRTSLRARRLFEGQPDYQLSRPSQRLVRAEVSRAPGHESAIP
jgi:hypothetical protein